MVQEGEEHTIEHEKGDVTICIREVASYETLGGSREIKVSYHIEYKGQTTPVAFWWQKRNEDPRDKMEEIVEFFHKTKEMVL